MTDKEKLVKVVKLADAMYHSAQYLTTDASRLHKAMEEYHQFIIHEYRKEEPVSKLSAIKAEIERRKEINGKNLDYSDPYMRGVMACYSEVLAIFDFDFPEEPVSEGLEEAAEKYAYELCPSIGVANTEAEQSFKAGAEWQKEQFVKNRLAACDKQTGEEAEIERDFVMSIIDNEHRLPAFDDAIKYGMKKMKQQMMAKAIDGTARPDDNEIWCNLASSNLKDGDKVKVIVIREE